MQKRKRGINAPEVAPVTRIVSHSSNEVTILCCFRAQRLDVLRAFTFFFLIEHEMEEGKQEREVGRSATVTAFTYSSCLTYCIPGSFEFSGEASVGQRLPDGRREE